MFGISAVICIAGIVIGLIFRFAAVARLSVPLLYILIVSFFFPLWAHEHQALAMGILHALLTLCILSWIITLIRKLRELRSRRAYERMEAEAALEELKGRQGIAV